ncbi:hypothetical protein AKJ18_07425 [Vibrio xuii]|nr:hypothetical protein AKJ18_07425 [Vibrio xuii]
MSEKQNQHFVPQFYFRNFSIDKSSIAMLLKSTGKVVPNVSIKKQASKDNFYGDLEVESKVTTYDSKHSSIIHSALREKPSQESVKGLVEAACFQYLRTLSRRSEQAPLMDYLGDFLANQIDDWPDSEPGVPDEIIKELNDTLRKSFKTIGEGKIPQTHDMFNVQEEVRKVDDLKSAILRNDTNVPFIFGDSPVVRFNPALTDTMYDHTSPMHHGLVVFFPLSSKVGFIMYDANAYEFKSQSKDEIHVTKKGDIDSLNKLQVFNSSNSVYFEHISTKDYVSSIWESVFDSCPIEKSKLAFAEEITLDLVPTGRTVATIEKPQIQFACELSFLTAYTLSDFPLIPFRERFVDN